MRFIDNHHLPSTTEWDARAASALADVGAGVCTVNARGQVWRDLKDALAELSHDKCWYCEAKQERSDDAVDHFRPKNQVKETARPHGGYWWLAFEKTNYRYSCTFCNSRRVNPATGTTEGKGDFFPLIDENRRGYTPGTEVNEEPTLIDPCRPEEPGWLDFLADGSPRAKYPGNPLRKEKAEKSIFFYHLDHQELNEARRKIAVDIEKWIKAADGLVKEFDAASNEVKVAYSVLVGNLIGAMKPDKPYSAFAKRIIAGNRHLEWVDDLYQAL